ncbi:MAG: FAD-dependent monooxygenase, partial [Steroidobacteraceae bacterium]
LNVGLRDASNLAWKLGWILQRRLRPEVLESYHSERYGHAQAMIDLADRFGAVLCQRNRAVAWLRDRLFLSLQKVPALRDYVLQMKFKPMARNTRGIVLPPDGGHGQLVGRMFIQPDVELIGGATVPLDAALGSGFALLGWRCDPLGGAPSSLLENLDLLGCRRIIAMRSRSMTHTGKQELASQGLTVIEDSTNALHFRFGYAGADWVLIRPDRYVACSGKSDDALEQLQRFVDRFMDSPVSDSPAMTGGAGVGGRLIPAAGHALSLVLHPFSWSRVVGSQS